MNTGNVDDHVGERLSGYIDGELTPQERQRVEIHIDSCERCREELADLRNLRQQVGRSDLSPYGEDEWRESMADPTVQTTRGIGWLLLIGGLLAIAGIGVYEFLTDPELELHMKVIIGAIYGGGTVLFLSVLRQRILERKSDKYKDVEI